MNKTENINNIGIFINFEVGKMKVKHLNKNGNTIFNNDEFNIDYLYLFEIDDLNETEKYNEIFDKIIKKIESKIELNQLGIPPTPSPATNVNDKINNVDLGPLSFRQKEYIKNNVDSVDTDPYPSVSQRVKDFENEIKKKGGKTKNKRNKKTKNTLKIIS